MILLEDIEAFFLEPFKGGGGGGGGGRGSSRRKNKGERTNYFPIFAFFAVLYLLAVMFFTTKRK